MDDAALAIGGDPAEDAFHLHADLRLGRVHHDLRTLIELDDCKHVRGEHRVLLGRCVDDGEGHDRSLTHNCPTARGTNALPPVSAPSVVFVPRSLHYSICRSNRHVVRICRKHPAISTCRTNRHINQMCRKIEINSTYCYGSLSSFRSAGLLNNFSRPTLSEVKTPISSMAFR